MDLTEKKPDRIPNRSSKRKSWSNKGMIGAMGAVKKDRMGVNAAVAHFGFHLPPFAIDY